MSPLMSPQNGRTALICAAANGMTATATLLIERGADKDAKNNVRIDYNEQSFAVLKNKWFGRVVVSFTFPKLEFFVLLLLLVCFICVPCSSFFILLHNYHNFILSPSHSLTHTLIHSFIASRYFRYTIVSFNR